MSTGGRAVTAVEAVEDVDVVILSIPLNRIPQVAPLIAHVPADTVVIDTSNYYPARDSRIEAIDAGQVESLWVTEQLGRPIAKAWNAIGSHSFEAKGRNAGSLDRIAIPVAADRDRDRQAAMALVEDTGFDAFDTGALADSWRQQPGAPATAPTSRARRCQVRWRRRRPSACPSGATWPSPRSGKGSGMPRPTPMRSTASA
ncbi:NADPH-dependent F420 reductase [Streptomyces phaeoluteigriseus]